MTASEGIRLLADYFSAQPTRQGLLARQLIGATGPEDDRVASALQQSWARELRSDGSLSGSLVATAWRILELKDLGAPPGPSLAQWLLDRQDRPGRFGEGCSRPRHTARVCEHFMEGFFAVAGPTERVAPLTLPVGRVIRSESAARFTGSCLALCAVVVAGHGSNPAVDRHLTSLAGIAQLDTLPSDHISMEMVAVVLATLARSGHRGDRTASALVELLGQRQRADGTWSGLDLFLSLDALVAERSEAAGHLIRRSVPALLAIQRRDGTFGTLARQERAWIGLQALTFTT